ncbi:hypothetical protein VN97_g2946 [Penicillium thymicola]|uniref:Uncharacterized protein n=1 Tax=Penicillium thymicola TaxID=293382 RepID=A0AAI9XB93_PENTH|nr:hypothetical protein VN97_g2946 [Penicillium thymicola]
MHRREIGINTMMHMRYFVRIAWILNAFKHRRHLLSLKTKLPLQCPKVPRFLHITRSPFQNALPLDNVHQ